MPWDNFKRESHHNIHDFVAKIVIESKLSFQNLSYMAETLKDMYISLGALFHQGPWAAALKSLSLIWLWH